MNSRVVSVNISREKGTSKQAVPSIELNTRGIIKDAHAGAWHRQVSLLSQERINHFSAKAGTTFKPGAFAENITTQGIDLLQIGIRDQLKIGNALLEVTQIGKACHGDGCAIYREVGRCVMPKEGIFARVLHAGHIQPGDPIEHVPRPLQIKILTLSDRAGRGEYPDGRGPVLVKRLERHFSSSHWKGVCHPVKVLPDEPEVLGQAVQNTIEEQCDILFTIGGTGLGPCDITPDVLRPMLDLDLSGIMAYICCKHAERLPPVLLSRSPAGMMGHTLIFSLPGNEKAFNEYIDEIPKILGHALGMIMGIDTHPDSL